jgi:uncharacterized protein
MEARARRLGSRFAALACVLQLLAVRAFAETLPPKPQKYFNDFAGVVSPAAAGALDEKLRQFERDTSNQIVAAVFRKMETESSIEDFTQRIYDSWKIGQEKEDNGAVLFVFIEDRKMRIHTGYGLEGALPDLTCKRIIDGELKPAFRAGNYEQGLTAGIDAMIAATRGEYQGTGRVAGDRRKNQGSGNWLPLLFPLFLFFAFAFSSGRRRGVSYDRRGRHRSGGWTILPMGGGGWGGGSFGGGGGSWGGGGGGFSGGGGMSGGGGASGDW